MAVPELNEASVHYGTTLNLIKEWRSREGFTIGGNSTQDEKDVEEGDLSRVEGSVHSVADSEAFLANDKLPWFRQFIVLLSRNSKAYRIWDVGIVPVFGVLIISALLTGTECKNVCE